MKSFTLILLILLIFHFFQPLLLFGQETEKVPNSINQFGLDACNKLSETPDYMLSPASISIALGMTYLGARGRTKEQIKNVFYYPEESKFLIGFSGYIDLLNNTTDNTTISIANRLWLGQGRIDPNPDFVQRNKDYFLSEVKILNFEDGKKASETINNWVATNTKNKILNLITPDLITPDAILILTNAVYFKSNWATKFDPSLTWEGKFWNDQNKKIAVDYMQGDGYYKTFENEHVNIIDLPYESDDFSFLIFLPKSTMKELEDLLIFENYVDWTISMGKRKFELVQIPKFKSTFELNLKNMLIEMGMPNAFNGSEFEGIGNVAGRIDISAVVHKTFIEFNEKGTEAAAATGLVFVSTSTRQPPPKKFIADHPFIYVIRHNASNSILFIGKMSNPKY